MNTRVLSLFAMSLALTACSGTDDTSSAYGAPLADSGVDTLPDSAKADTTTEDVAEDTSDDTAEDTSVDASKDTSTDVAKDTAADVIKDTSADVVKDTSVDSASAAVTIEAIKSLALGSSCYKYQWKDRGQMPKGYIQGMALVYARAFCNPTRSDVLVVSKANTDDDAHDAISWYNSNFTKLNMPNKVAGIDTLRHTYTLLMGLGMRESSGEHCCGRDTSATNTTADTAEAGLFQTSYNSHVFSVELPKLFAAFRADASGCFLDPFKNGVTCNAANWANYGSGDGFAFQQLEKECPAFAAEYAAVMIRVSGGTAGHYGPLLTKAAEIMPECDAMYQQVQAIVEKNPAVCSAL